MVISVPLVLPSMITYFLNVICGVQPLFGIMSADQPLWSATCGNQSLLSVIGGDQPLLVLYVVINHFESYK